MKISIVTISYNQARYLSTCIESILTQTNCDLEYIVVDPGSTDGSREIIESYGDRIVKVFESDAGPADGLNKGFAQATGDIYGFINSDDYLLPGAIATVLGYFSNAKPNVFLTGGGYSDSIDGGRMRIRPSTLTAQSLLHRAAVMFQQGTFFPAKLFNNVGGFNVANKTCWDYELFLDFLMSGASHHVLNEELAVFRLHEQSISGSGRLERLYLSELDQLFLKHCGRSRSLSDKINTIYLRFRRRLLRDLKSC